MDHTGNRFWQMELFIPDWSDYDVFEIGIHFV